MSATEQALTMPTPSLVQSAAPTFLTDARSFNVVTVEDAESALAIRVDINKEIKRLNMERHEETDPLDESKKKIMARYARPLTMLDEALKLYDAKVRAFNEQQREIARQRQAKLDAEARAERERLQRIADEARRKADAEVAAKRKAAEEAAAAGRAAEAAKLHEQAQRTEERAQEKAETFESRAAATVAPVVQVEAPKVKGVSARKNWKHRIKDPTKINAPFMQPNEVLIGKQVRALGKDAQSVIGDGVEIWSEEGFAS